jgi:hypothetical protein
MSILINRSVFSDNAVLEDVSVRLNDFKGDSFNMPFVAAEDFLYIGSDMPFNHRWFEIQSPNDQTASLEISVWEGDTWAPANDVIDQTSLGGVALAQSGHILFRPDEDEGWSREDTNQDSDQITGLTDVTIYGLYWARLRWTADLASTTTIKYIGHKFSNDDDVRLIFPILLEPKVLDQFEDGKTNWDQQHFWAAEQIIRDLRRRNIVFSRNQILDMDLLSDASVFKVAEAAFRSFGKDFVQERDEARSEYNKQLDKAIKHIDQNKNAILEQYERFKRPGFMKR